MTEKQLCGLKKTQALKVIGALKAIEHAVDERDWERLSRKEYKEAMKGLEDAAEIMTEAGCLCPPHELFDPDEKMLMLKSAVDKQATDRALAYISELTLSLLQDYAHDLEP